MSETGKFITHWQGWIDLFDGSNSWESDGYFAVCATATEAPDAETQNDYEDILEECADADYDRVDLTGKAISQDESTGQINFSCETIKLCTQGDVSAKYLYILQGTAASPEGAIILGHIDLNPGGGNLTSINGEFSYTPPSGVLFKIPQITES